MITKTANKLPRCEPIKRDNRHRLKSAWPPARVESGRYLRPVAGLLAALVMIPQAFALNFDFTPAPGTSQTVIDGFTEAAGLWTQQLTDPITVNIDIAFTNLAPGVLGATGSKIVLVSYGAYLAALTNAINTADDDVSVGNLQAFPDFDMLINRTTNSPNGAGSAVPYLDDDGDANNIPVRLTRANAKALGLVAGDDPAPDGSITFNSDFNFDFDRSDGIGGSSFDFVGVSAHEIGHAMGLISGVDILDANSPPIGGPYPDDAFSFVSPADLFRFSSNSLAQGAAVIDWTADTRAKFFSVDGGSVDRGGFSTGRNFGDGEKCSHWKDDLNLGLMDPTLASGELADITDLDVQMFDVIGYERFDSESLNSFAFSSIPTPQAVDSPIAVSLTARTPSGAIANNFNGSALLQGCQGTGSVATVLITELDPNTPDAMEFMNVSTQAIDISGWQVHIYDRNSWTNPLSVFVVPNGTTCDVGDVFTLTEFGISPGTYPNFLYGGNINWVFPELAAILLRDDSSHDH